MAISSTIKVTSGVEGDYTLAELLELLGSPASLKKALSGLESASKKATAALKALNTAEELRKVDVARDIAAQAESTATLKAQEEKTAGTLENLADAKSTKADGLNERASALDAAEKAVADGNDRVLRDKKELEKAQANLADERKEHEASVSAAARESLKAMGAAQKIKNDAQRILDDANAKMGRMKEALA